MPPTLRLSRLSPAQRALFPRLSFLRSGFVLYGGTAVALQTGHRSEARRVGIERAVAGWRGEVPELPVEDPDLSAPGFREAVTD